MRSLSEGERTACDERVQQKLWDLALNLTGALKPDLLARATKERN